MNRTPERVTATNVTLDNCDREQIQFSNAVQPHVVLLVADASDLRILQASANAAELGAGSAEELVGRNLNTLLPAENRERLLAEIAKLKEESAPVHVFAVSMGGELRDVLVHLMNGALLVELERQGPYAAERQRELYSELRKGIARLNSSTTVVPFLDEAVRVIAACTGFERVMAYRFQADGSGEVVAEAVAPGLERYLGLHYPAADIPKPARRLFSLTWLRHLPDVNYVPIPIVPQIYEPTGDLLDLSYAFSRSVSVMYTEYLRNMGVHATMVLTLFKGGKLWGLISCMQHSGPWHLNIEVRGICEMLAQTVSLLMSAKEDAEFASYRESLSRALEQLIQQAAGKESIADALLTRATTLISAMDAAGAAVVFEGDVRLVGECPPREIVEELMEKLATQIQTVWSSEMSSIELGIDRDRFAEASGLLATRIGYAETDLVLWFRPEYRKSVKWAGDPSKLVVRTPGRESRLHPNGSFDVWQSEVHGRAKPWLDCEIEFAAKLGRGILDVIVERSREMAQLNRELTRSNRELEEFAYTASHDLKSPLRSISMFAQIVLRDRESQLSDQQRPHLENIVRLAQRMHDVIEGMLAYSELGHATIVRNQVDLNEACAQAVDLLRGEIERSNAEIQIPRPLPVYDCDMRWASQILLNLMGNALKYTDKPRPVVEVGYREGGDNGGRRGGPIVFYVKDNGIGIAKEHMSTVFRLFQRLHHQEAFGGGSGLGLSIVARAIERHGGKLWLESEPGVGTTFFFTLKDGK